MYLYLFDCRNIYMLLEIKLYFFHVSCSYLDYKINIRGVLYADVPYLIALLRFKGPAYKVNWGLTGWKTCTYSSTSQVNVSLLFSRILESIKDTLQDKWKWDKHEILRKIHSFLHLYKYIFALESDAWHLVKTQRIVTGFAEEEAVRALPRCRFLLQQVSVFKSMKNNPTIVSATNRKQCKMTYSISSCSNYSWQNGKIYIH